MSQNEFVTFNSSLLLLSDYVECFLPDSVAFNSSLLLPEVPHSVGADEERHTFNSSLLLQVV